MTTLIVHDSAYGNTARVAEGIGAAIPGASLHRLTELDPGAMPAFDMLIVGSPTQGGRPTSRTLAWLDKVPADRLRGARVAAFDTRLAASDRGFALRSLMGLIGYAAPKILTALERKGGRAVAASEGFIVGGREGPLRAGELERASLWARALLRAPAASPDTVASSV